MVIYYFLKIFNNNFIINDIHYSDYQSLTNMIRCYSKFKLKYNTLGKIIIYKNYHKCFLSIQNIIKIKKKLDII